MNKEVKEVYDVILQLSSQEDCENFFADLVTYNELNNMAQRLQAAKLLKEGYTYVQIIERTGISNTTLSRVSTALKHGKGYKKFLKWYVSKGGFSHLFFLSFSL